MPTKTEYVRLARRTFVSRVQMIYTKCMESEMSKGTSIRHKTPGMDPQRLLIDEEAEAAAVTLSLLRYHLSSRIYNITVREWALGAQKVNGERIAAQRRARAARIKRLKAIIKRFNDFFVWIAVNLLICQIMLSFIVGQKVVKKLRKLRGYDDEDLPPPPSKPSSISFSALPI